MDPNAPQALRDLIAHGDRFFHVTHVNPDGDGIGSALAFHRYLLACGKRSEFVVPAPIPRRLEFLASPGDIRVLEAAELPLPSDAVYLIYDVSTLRRLGPLEETVRRSTRPVVVFDHHDGAIEFPSIALVDEGAGATAQVVFDVLDEWGVPMTPEIALPLYVALLADTGSFNYGKTTPHTHDVAARLLQAGVDPLDVHGRLEGNRSLHAVRLGGEILRSLAIDAADPRVGHATMTLAQFQRGGAEAIDALDLVNHTISLSGVLAGVLLIEPSAGTSRLSLRSKGSTSIVEVARAFGGGGHRNAAGASVARPIDEVREEVLTCLRNEMLRQHGPPPR